MASKACRSCRKRLPLERFHRDRSKKDGRQSWCRECQKRHWVSRRKRSPGMAAWDRRRARRRYEKTRADYIARARSRSQAIALAAKALTPRQRRSRDRVYAYARALEELSGLHFHVDHIRPWSLSRDERPSNLQILLARDNLTKRDRADISMRERSWRIPKDWQSGDPLKPADVILPKGLPKKHPAVRVIIGLRS